MYARARRSRRAAGCLRGSSADGFSGGLGLPRFSTPKPGHAEPLIATLGNSLRGPSFRAARAPKCDAYSDAGLVLNQILERGPYEPISRAWPWTRFTSVVSTWFEWILRAWSSYFSAYITEHKHINISILQNWWRNVDFSFERSLSSLN
jgi:hypothetical protein